MAIPIEIKQDWPRARNYLIWAMRSWKIIILFLLFLCVFEIVPSKAVKCVCACASCGSLALLGSGLSGGLYKMQYAYQGEPVAPTLVEGWEESRIGQRETWQQPPGPHPQGALELDPPSELY